MANNSKSEKSSWGGFLFALAVMGVIALAILTPLEQLQAVYAAQRESVQLLLGDAEEEIYQHSFSGQTDANVAGMAELSNSTGVTAPITSWMSGRNETWLIWANLISYRLDLVHIWLLSTLPLLVAAFIDGFHVREARKYAFFSQSPIRHKAGIRSAIMATVLAAASIAAPVIVTPLLIPGALVMLAFAGWLWISNLQKRL